jgi:hypothetical protein
MGAPKLKFPNGERWDSLNLIQNSVTINHACHLPRTEEKMRTDRRIVGSAWIGVSFPLQDWMSVLLLAFSGEQALAGPFLLSHLMGNLAEFKIAHNSYNCCLPLFLDAA